MENKTKKKEAIYICLIIGITLLLIFRAHFSFQQSDESFYLAITKRLLNGDSLIIDEWFPTQFYTPILLPFLWLYNFFFGCDGILLFFRVLVLCFICCVSIEGFLFFVKERNMAPLRAFVISGLCLMYAKSNNFGAGYSNLCVYFAILFVIRMLRKKDFSAGILAALCTLCMPFFGGAGTDW